MCFQFSITTFWIWHAKFSSVVVGDGSEVVKIIFHCRTRVQRDLATHEESEKERERLCVFVSVCL